MGSSESVCGESESLEHLKIDQACFNITSLLNDPVTVFTVSDDCVKCSPKLLTALSPNEAKEFAISTKYPQTIYVCNDNVTDFCDETTICSKYESLGEYGFYTLTIESSTDCRLSTIKEPVNSYLAILWCFCFFFVTSLLWIVGNYLFKKFRAKKIVCNGESSQANDQVTDLSAQQPQKKRLESIDTFRGIAIVIMIFVNNGAGEYFFFDHSTWNGLLLADFVFPWFLWIMGVCIPISIRSQLRNSTQKVIFGRILKRSVQLFLLGLILSSGNVIEHLRIMGVLQRFGITYFVVACIHLLFSSWFAKEKQFPKLVFADDVVRLLPHWVFMLVLVVMHTILTFTVYVPGCPKGYLGPGGRHDNGSYWNCTGGSTGYIDRVVLGENHLYQHPTSKIIYDSLLPYDPEGILGTITSCFQVFLGVQAGAIILTYNGPKDRVVRWTFWSILTGTLTAILTQCSQNDGWIPVNKNLWSLSFVFATSCFAFVLLIICYLIIDVKQWWNGAPFLYPGKNSIVLYCGHSIASQNFPFTWVLLNKETHSLKLISSLWTTCAWVLVSVWLFKIKFFPSL